MKPYLLKAPKQAQRAPVLSKLCTQNYRVCIQTTKYKVLSELSDVCKCDGRMNEMSLYCE